MNTHEILAVLVGFDTTSSRSNRAIMVWIRDYLADNGAESRLLAGPDGTKFNLIARIGPDVPGGVALSGHSDVVPVAGQDWTSDPFRLVRRGSRAFGRGACDMKGFLACVLAAVPRFRHAGLTRPVDILVSYDEEIGCFGARPLIEALSGETAPPAIVIVGEPTGMAIVDSHPGAHAETVRFFGCAGHSSHPERAVSAVEAALDFMTGLRDIARRQTPDGIVLNLARIKGGTAHNIVAGEAEIEWSARFDDPEAGKDLIAAAAEACGAIETAMNAADPACSVVCEEMLSIPALRPEPDSDAFRLCARLTGRNDSARAAYGTEAGLFQQAGFSTVVCGPGDIAQAHTADEYIEEAQLAACDAFMVRLADELSSS